MSTRRGLAAVTLSLALAAAASACGTATTPGTGTSAAATSTAAAVPTVGQVVPLEDVSAKVAAAVTEKRTARVGFTDGAEDSGTAQVSYDGASPAMSMTMGEGQEQTGFVLVDDVIYIGGADYEEMTGGKRWVKLDPEGGGLFSQLMGPVVGVMTSAMKNPGDQLGLLADRGAKVSAVADGVVSYTVELTKDDLVAMAREQLDELTGLADVVDQDLPASATYTISVDAQDLPRRFEVTLEDTTMTMEYSEWGRPVDIAAPPASEVGTLEMPGPD